MKLLYVLFILVIIPMIGIIIGNLITEFWSSIIKSIKGLGSCVGVIVIILIGFAIMGILGSWMFKAVEEGGVFLSILCFTGFIAIVLSGIKK